MANEIAHGRELIDYRRRAVTTPNNDTLYSRTILDLSTGPVRRRGRELASGPEGPVQDGLRGYQPKSDMIDNRFRIPGVERVE